MLSVDTGLNSLVGVAQTTLEFDGPFMMVGNLRLDLQTSRELKELGWHFSGLSVKFEAYPVRQSTFVCQTLSKGQRLMRESLCGLLGQE